MKQLSHYFRSSIILGTFSRLSVFLCSLMCGYLVSRVMTSVAAGDYGGVLNYSAVAILLMVLSLLPVFLLKRCYGLRALHEEEAFLEHLYTLILKAEIPVETAGGIDVRLNKDAAAITKYYLVSLPKAIGSGAVILAAGAIMLAIDWRIGVIMLCLNMLQLLPTFIYEKWTRRIYDRTHAAEEDYRNWILEGYRGARTLKAYCAEKWFLSVYRQKTSGMIKAGCTAERVGTMEAIIYSVIDNLLQYGRYIILGAFVLYGKTDSLDLPVLIVLSDYLFSSIQDVFDLRMSWFRCKSAYEQLGIHTVPERTAASGALIETTPLSRCFDGAVCMRCGRQQISRGERILLTGENGGGKTTLLRILAGFDEPTEGVVSRCGSISICLQSEPVIHIKTVDMIKAVSENNDISADELRKHLKAFNITDISEQYFDELSYGQRKKLCLALALSKKAELLVLDEPTNHLDAEGVEHLLDVLRQRKEGILVCTHDKRLDLSWSRVWTAKGGEISECAKQ